MAKPELNHEGQELKQLQGIFTHSTEGAAILTRWIEEYVHLRNPKCDPVIEGKRIFVLDLMEDLNQNLDQFYDEPE